MSPATGRAGRAEAERRLETARRGAELLERKQRILEHTVTRLRGRAAQAQQAWEEAARAAAVWLQRSAALDGMERIREAAPGAWARVHLQTAVSMGIEYPASAGCELPAFADQAGSSALVFAARSHAEALRTAAVSAAARRALELVEADLEGTRARQRAVENRWIPRLERTLDQIVRRIEEQEMEETLRLRWAADRS
ncbi:V-type ATP synthase subunit D [Arthrobacter saudimassiliensis]|uniref:V-type ATP synthase subunit D n=1 Tax=Arthrobacter saudimassiliensis TaxID=1461584 RepID=A0A078MSZ9_9MICC|nr:V-type ATP synthase subunit D [Arthrobacter saudimassiliensis]